MSADELIHELHELEGAYQKEVAPLRSEPDIRAAQARYLGKKGRVSDLMKVMGKLPAGDRPRVGEVANRVKRFVEDETEKRLRALVDIARAQDLLRTIDVTLPGRPVGDGHLHIL